MKILTGHLRGQRIEFKPNPHLRPTADKVRQAIFNSLQGEIEGKKVLDLYSGTGAFGIEALSSGAQTAIFVEKNAAQCRAIHRSLEFLGLADNTRVESMNAIQALRSFAREGLCFDLIFLDPPYEKDLTLRTLRAISETSIFHEASLVICETRKEEPLPEGIGKLTCVKNKRYGDTRILFFSGLRRKPKTQEGVG